MFNRGGIAQLVERLLCKQDVDSSNLSGSTIRRVPPGLAHGRPLLDAANALSLSKGLYTTILLQPERRSRALSSVG